MRLLTVILAASFASCASTENANVSEVFTLKHQSADKIVRMVADSERKKLGLAELAADGRTNCIMAVGTRESVDRVGRRIRELDVEKP